MPVHHTFLTPIGPIRIIADRQGLCRIILAGTSHHGLVPETTPSTDPVLSQARQQITEYFKGDRRDFTLPLSIRGTPFEKKVWNVLQTIPWGEVWSYGQAGRALGDRNLARAVGRAAGANPLPLVIPCHRVIGADRSLTGFAAGIEMKKYLLQLEGWQVKQRAERLFLMENGERSF
ncbi:methylated-DNA--[protein]-cysteine S-methyltransferase [Desulfolithobacter sp.]